MHAKARLLHVYKSAQNASTDDRQGHDTVKADRQPRLTVSKATLTTSAGMSAPHLMLINAPHDRETSAGRHIRWLQLTSHQMHLRHASVDERSDSVQRRRNTSFTSTLIKDA